MTLRARLLLCLLACLACASTPAEAPPASDAAAPAEPAPVRRPEVIDCSYEYSRIATPGGYVNAVDDVAGSYLAARRLTNRLRADPNATSATVDEAWKAQVAAAQTLLRACHCWDQLDRLDAEAQEGVLAARGIGTKRLKAEIGRKIAAPCQKVFEAETAGD